MAILIGYPPPSPMIFRSCIHSKLIAAFIAYFAISAVFCWAWVPNAQEEQIASYLRTDPNQHRPELVFDPILAQIARGRAADMAARGYFDHVNPDGVAANYLVQNAGYGLPSWWGTDPTKNYIESIGEGYTTAQAVWDAWMNSSGHKTHLLALVGFYATETRYGIGYVYAPGSQYGYYWVVITAPPAEVYITTPQNGTSLTSDEVDLTGTTCADVGITSISADIENQNGATTPVLTTGTDWSMVLHGLAAGKNKIHLQGRDAGNNLISETRITVTYSETSNLVVSVSGSGAVTATLSGTTIQQVGKSITIAATPAKGFLFSGWTGGIQSSSSPLKFTMQKNLCLQANFVENPFLATKGSYTGLMTSGTEGYLSVNLGNTGSFSGQLNLGTTRYSFKGRFNLLGEADLLINRNGMSALSLHLTLDVSGGKQITGSVEEGLVVSSFQCNLATFGKYNPAPQAGNYTFVFAPSTSGTTDPPTPVGNSNGTLRINASGVAVFSGKLADNTRFSFTSSVSKDGTVPLYISMPRNQGLVEGLLTFANLPSSDATGKILWTKSAVPTNTSFPQGFSVVLDGTVSLYQRPAIQPMPASVPLCEIRLEDGSATPLLACAAMISDSGAIQFTTPPPNKLSFTHNPSTGTLSGSFIHPSTNKKCTIQAVYLQKTGDAYGYYTGPTGQGAFSLRSVVGGL